MSRKARNGVAPTPPRFAWLRGAFGIVLAGLTLAGVKWMFDYMEDQTMWENRFVLAGAGIVFLLGLVWWVRIVLSFSCVGEKTRRSRVRSRRLRRWANRILDKLMPFV